MRALAANLPTALREGFASGLDLAPPALRSSQIVAVGMGGSGIAADLARGVIEAETPAMVSVVRSPELPRGTDRRSHVILVSYSGNTWETLRAFDAAGRVGAHRTVITSGGELAELAHERGVPVLPVPAGLPPRSAVGHLLGGFLGLLDPWFPESNEARVARVMERVRTLIGSLVRAGGPAAKLATRLDDRLPFIYAESSFLALARRWKTQIEENAKRLAVFDEVPELFHNAIVGWDATSRTEARRAVAVLLEWSEEAAMTRRSLRYLERLLLGHGARVVRVPLDAEDRLEALVGGVAFGDHVSLFLADRRRVDPLPVDAIGRLKAALGSSARSDD
jgi:glucose/mannose-6-phosphate isomerase